MKTWTSILAAGAILALAAPAGYAGNSHIPSAPGSHGSRGVHPTIPPQSPVKGVVDGKKLKALIARNKALVATMKALLAQQRALAARLDALGERPAVGENGSVSGPGRTVFDLSQYTGR